MASTLSVFSSPQDGESNPPPLVVAPENKEMDLPAQGTANSATSAQAPVSAPATAPETHPGPAPEGVFGVLRRSIEDESQPPDSVIRGVSEAARALTIADGVAIAFRTRGVILCRARSGELAPDLGSYVNANSGISGECLRTASILVCQDARTDARVDNVICERMGIRSIVVVPLRGSVGISGILEVFSKRVNAFGNREINCLRNLAELAEAAYDRERQAQQEATRAALRSAQRLPGLFARAVASDSESDGAPGQFDNMTGEPQPERLWWAIGVATVALLLILGVWLSWHGPISELTELEALQNHKGLPVAPQPKVVTAPKPEPGIVLIESDAKKPASVGHSRLNLHVRTAAAKSDGAPSSVGAPFSNPANSVEQAPKVTISSDSQADLPALASDAQPLPVVAAPISRGVTQGKLIRKVDPVYPLQARTNGITGSVVLEIRVAEDGTVRDVRTVSGDPQLASAAVDAVRQWQYAPTLLDSRPIATTQQVTVLFKLP
jgi:TonB family protein